MPTTRTRRGRASRGRSVSRQGKDRSRIRRRRGYQNSVESKRRSGSSRRTRGRGRGKSSTRGRKSSTSDRRITRSIPRRKLSTRRRSAESYTRNRSLKQNENQFRSDIKRVDKNGNTLKPAISSLQTNCEPSSQDKFQIKQETEAQTSRVLCSGKQIDETVNQTENQFQNGDKTKESMADINAELFSDAISETDTEESEESTASPKTKRRTFRRKRWPQRPKWFDYRMFAVAGVSALVAVVLFKYFMA